MAANEKTQVQLLADINSQILTNNNEEITGPVMNQILQDLTASMINRIDDADLLGLKDYNDTRVYAVGDTVVQGASIYRCTTAGATGVFNPAHWNEISASAVNSLQQVMDQDGIMTSAVTDIVMLSSNAFDVTAQDITLDASTDVLITSFDTTFISDNAYTVDVTDYTTLYTQQTADRVNGWMLRHYDFSDMNEVKFELNLTNSFILTDTKNSKGMSYAANYATANATNPRWLTDKDYVDGAVTAAIDGNGIFTGSNIVPTNVTATLTDSFTWGGDVKTIAYGTGGGVIITSNSGSMIVNNVSIANAGLSTTLDANSQIINNIKNLGIGTNQYGTNADKVLAWAVGTAPTTNITNVVQSYTTDGTDLIFRNENGDIVNVFAGSADGNGIFTAANDGGNLAISSINLNGNNLSLNGGLSQTLTIDSNANLSLIGSGISLSIGVITGTINNGGVIFNNNSASGFSWGETTGYVGSATFQDEVSYKLYANTSREGILDLYYQGTAVGRFQADPDGIGYELGTFAIGQTPNISTQLLVVNNYGTTQIASFRDSGGIAVMNVLESRTVDIAGRLTTAYTQSTTEAGFQFDITASLSGNATMARVNFSPTASNNTGLLVTMNGGGSGFRPAIHIQNLNSGQDAIYIDKGNFTLWNEAGTQYTLRGDAANDVVGIGTINSAVKFDLKNTGAKSIILRVNDGTNNVYDHTQVGVATYRRTDFVIRGNNDNQDIFKADESASLILLPNLPTSAPATSGALWNNSGVINIVP